MKALILCAGHGTRLGLKKTPKCMVKVNHKPVLEHLVNHLNKAGITEIIINVHKDYDKIFKYFGTRLLYFYEPVLMGEHGTELALQDWLGDEYIIMNGDTLTNVEIDQLCGLGISTIFVKKHYAGTKYINISSGPALTPVDCVDWYYFDIGTPKKLAKARKWYKTHA